MLYPNKFYYIITTDREQEIEMKQLKLFLYPVIILLITVFYLTIFGEVRFIHFINVAFLINLPFFAISIILFTIQRGLYSPLRYSFKRFAIFFFKNKRKKLMDEMNASTTQEMEEKMKVKYLYSSPSFQFLKYTLLQSTLIFLITLMIAMMY